jgi:four helix bundle protein
MRDHSKLRAFELADALSLLVYEHTRRFPKEETFGLTSQMRRAAVSVASNIVEGCARSTEADYLRFLDMAYGAARELEYQISLACRLSYLDGDATRTLQEACVETCKVLNGLIRSLRLPSGLRPPASGL